MVLSIPPSALVKVTEIVSPADAAVGGPQQQRNCRAWR